MPIVLLPFLILDGRRFRLRLLACAVTVIVAGFACSTILWGTATFRPVFFAAGRTAQHLSIYRFLDGVNSPLRMLDIRGNIEFLAGPILLLALARAWYWSRREEVNPATSSVMAILIMITLYPVGFPQYQMVLFLLATYWFTRYGRHMRNPALVALALCCHFGWLAAFDVTENVIDIDAWRMQEWIGLPTFVLECFLMVAVVRSTRRRADQAGPLQHPTRPEHLDVDLDQERADDPAGAKMIK
jgi:hypothetical protein